MNVTRGFLLWLAGAGGLFLCYAAYKNQSPTAMLTGFTASYTGTGQGNANPPNKRQTGQGTQSPAPPAPYHPPSGGTAFPTVERWTLNSDGNQVALPSTYDLSPHTYVPGNE